MAEPKLQGDALLKEIAGTRLQPGELAFWWSGQASYIFKGGPVIYIDPYLSPSPARQTPPLLRPEEVNNADLLLCTHDHSDHIDPDTLVAAMTASPGALLLVPNPHVGRVTALGIPRERVVGMRPGESLSRAGVEVVAVKAKHEFFDEDPDLGFPYLGYVVETNGYRFYHSGDTVPFDGLIETLRALGPDAMFLPINGRDAERFARGCIGNLTFQEAVDLAGEVNPRWALPMHWDMFLGNQEDPERFVRYLRVKYPEIQTWVGQPGERVVLSKERGR